MLSGFALRSGIFCVAVSGAALAVWGLTHFNWWRVWELALAAAPLRFLPPAVNVALSGVLCAQVLSAAVSLALSLRSGEKVWEQDFFLVVTFICVTATGVTLLLWGINSVNWSAVWAFVASSFGLVGSLPPPLNAALSVTIYAEAVGVAVSTFYGVSRKSERMSQGLRLLKRWTLNCAYFAAGCVLLWVLYQNSDHFARLLAVVIFVALAALIMLSLGGLAKELAPVIDVLRGPIARNRYDTEAWKKALAGLDPESQAAFLRRTTPETLGLLVRDFLALLQSVEGVIKKDPAQSAYWAKRQQIEQIIRQERTG